MKHFLATEPYTTRREPDPDREGGYLFRLSVQAAVPDSIGLIFGDFVHNLRASLDNLVWELAVHRSRKLAYRPARNGLALTPYSRVRTASHSKQSMSDARGPNYELESGCSRRDSITPGFVLHAPAEVGCAAPYPRNGR